MTSPVAAPQVGRALPADLYRPEAGGQLGREMDLDGGPSGAVPSSSAARVPDVLITTRSPSSRKRGSSEKCECTSERSDCFATSMRTASRVMPRFSGGAGASSSGGRSKESGCSSGRRARRAGRQGGHVVAPAATSSLDPVAPARAVALDQVEEGGHDARRFGPVRDVLAGERGLVHGRTQVARIDGPHAEGGKLGGQHGTELVECGLAGAVATPARRTAPPRRPR